MKFRSETAKGIWKWGQAWAYNGGLGAEPLVRGGKPPEAETLLAFGYSMKAANLPKFLKFRNAEN